MNVNLFAGLFFWGTMARVLSELMTLSVEHTQQGVALVMQRTLDGSGRDADGMPDIAGSVMTQSRITRRPIMMH